MPTPCFPFGDQNIPSVWEEGEYQHPDAQTGYRNKAIGDYFYKTCATGYRGTGKWYEIGEGQIISNVSQTDADTQALSRLLEEGQAFADAEGTCELEPVCEILTSIQSIINWDWVVDRATNTPMCVKATEISSAYTLLPMCNLTYYYETGMPVTAFDAHNCITPYKLHDEHGLMNIKFSDVFPSKKGLLAAWWVTTGYQAPTLTPFQSYIGYLISDFGSEELWEDSSLGGLLGIVETADSYAVTYTDDHFNGYIISYKSEIVIRKWNSALGMYEVRGTIPFNLKNRTAYIGLAIQYVEGNWVANIYINGVLQFTLADDNIVSLTVFRYQRDVLSMDYWFGDIVIGSISPFATKSPPPVTVKYFAPEEAYFDYPVTPPVNQIKLEPKGTATSPLDAVSGNAALVTPLPEKYAGFERLYDPAVSGVGTPKVSLGVRWNPNNWDDPKIQLRQRLYGCCPAFEHMWYKTIIATFPYGMNRQFDRKLYSYDLIYFWRIPAAEFPDNIPAILANDTGYYNDFAFLAPLDINCKPSGTDKPLTPEDMLIGVGYESMQHQTFPYNNHLYTKDEVANNWIYFELDMQATDVIEIPTTIKLRLPWVKMLSGAEGIRTRKYLGIPEFDDCNCPYPVCGDANYFRSSAFNMTVESSTRTYVSTSKVCDSLFSLGNTPLAYSLQPNGWNWEITLEDILVGTGLDAKRKIRLTMHAIAPELMGQVLNSSQVYQYGKDLLRLRVWRSDWELPVWDSNILMISQVAVVPDPPPGFTVGMPPEVTMVFEVDPLTYEYDKTLPLFGDATGTFYFELLLPLIGV